MSNVEVNTVIPVPALTGEVLERVGTLEKSRQTYPESRATIRDSKRNDGGVDYSSFNIGEAVILPEVEYNSLVSEQMPAYLRICNTIATAYAHTPSLQRYYEKAFLQFEPPSITNLIQTYPVTTFSGARYGSDVLITPPTAEGERPGYKTLEVNLEAAGGIHQGVELTKRLDSPPVTPDVITVHALYALNEYYKQACEALGISFVPYNERTVAIVENDGWYVGSALIEEQFRALGLNIMRVPREACHYDAETNTLAVDTPHGDKTSVDQLLLYFPLEEDETGGKVGDITTAIANHAVVAESSAFTQIVLNSKATLALISRMSREPESQFTKVLGIDPKDLATIKEMVAETYQWDPKYFQDIPNKFMLREYLREQPLIAKITTGGRYGGNGICILDKNSPYYDTVEVRDLFRFTTRMTEDALLTYQQEKGTPALARLLRSTISGSSAEMFTAVLETELRMKPSRISEVRTLLNLLKQDTSEVDKTTYYNTAYQQLEYTKEEEMTLFASLHERFHDKPFQNIKEIEQLFLDLSYLIMKRYNGVNAKRDNPGVRDLQRRFIDALSAGVYLPIVFQQSYESMLTDKDRNIELRVAGTVGSRVEDHISQVIALRAPGAGEAWKSIYPVTIEDFTGLTNQQTTRPESEILESEAGAPHESTLLELSVIPEDRRFHRTAVLMSGAGRHARILAQQSDEVIGIDISPQFVDLARARSTDYTNISYEVAEANAFLEEQQDPFDLITINGNSIIYVEQEQQEVLMQRIYDSLEPGGMFVMDFVDSDKYEQQLGQEGPYLTASLEHEGKTLQRIARRHIREGEQETPLDRVMDAGLTYFVDHRETMDTTYQRHFPQMEAYRSFLEQMGYNTIDIIPIQDDFYPPGNMMRERWILSATK